MLLGPHDLVKNDFAEYVPRVSVRFACIGRQVNNHEKRFLQIKYII